MCIHSHNKIHLLYHFWIVFDVFLHRALEREKSHSPKFVVSLDGIDPEMMEKFEDRMGEDLEEDMETISEEMTVSREESMESDDAAMRARNIVRVRPMQMSVENPPGESFCWWCETRGISISQSNLFWHFCYHAFFLLKMPAEREQNCRKSASFGQPVEVGMNVSIIIQPLLASKLKLTTERWSDAPSAEAPLFEEKKKKNISDNQTIPCL